jgi:tripartite ATP-independent transporter DctM subunit
LEMNNEANPGVLGKAVFQMNKFNRAAWWLQLVGVILLFLLMVYTFIDVFMRYFLNRPFAGSTELCQLFVTAIIWVGIAWAQVSKSHLRVDLITSRLSPRHALIMEGATYILLIWVAVMITWQGTINTIAYISHGTSSSVLHIPMAPFAATIPLGCLFYLVILLRDLLTKINEAITVKIKASQWLLMLGIPLILIVLQLLFMQPIFSGLFSKPITALLGVLVGLIFIFLGMPVGPSLGMTGFVFVGNLLGSTAGIAILRGDLFRLSSDYTWSTVVFFLLMGEFIISSGIGTDAFNTAYKWFGHFRGGLAISTVAACALLSAVIGMPIPVIIMMIATALPVMRLRKYAEGFSTGVISSAACLGPLIPPSLTFIMYGIFTQTSIGKLFIAGIIPGIVLSLAFMITAYIMCRINPSLGPAAEKASWKERFSSLKTSGPILILFIIVLGGIYFGVFTATEGGAIGAAGALIIGLATRRMKWTGFKNSLFEAAKNGAFMTFMVVCTQLFGRVLTSGNLSNMMISFLSEHSFSPMMIVTIVLILFLIVGFFMDSMTCLILFVPVLAPTLKATGIDMIWFGVCLAVVVNLGAYTPPYGINLFVTSSTSGVKLPVIFRGVMPFVYANVIVVLLLLFIPALSVWLPNFMK